MEQTATLTSVRGTSVRGWDPALTSVMVPIDVGLIASSAVDPEMQHLMGNMHGHHVVTALLREGQDAMERLLQGEERLL